jgi:hypothetical protein
MLVDQGGDVRKNILMKIIHCNECKTE